jgi:parvulin-like peptidyl-prolyl isomerase
MTNINIIKYFISPFLCLFLLFTSSACSPNAESKKAVVIRAGDRVVTVDDIEKEVTITSIENGILKNVIWSSINELVDRIVDDSLVLQYGKENSISLTEIELEEAIQNIVNDYPGNSFNEMLSSRCIDYNEWKKRFSEHLLIKKIIKEQTESMPPVYYHAIKSYYQERKEDFSHPSRAKFVHIITKTRKEAEAVLARLKGGEDMQELVKEQSLGLGIYRDDGMRWKNKYILPSPLSDIIFSIPVGKLSNIIKTPYGFHIIKVLKREPPGVKDLLEVKAEIEDRLRSKAMERRYTVWLNELRNNYPVKINYTLLDKVRSSNEK